MLDLRRLPHLCFFNGAGDHDGAVLDGSHRCIVLLHHISGDLIGRAVKIQIQAVLCQTLFNGTGGELTVNDILNRFLGASGEVPDGAGNVGLGGVRIQVAVKEDGQEVLLLAGIGIPRPPALAVWYIRLAPCSCMDVASS